MRVRPAESPLDEDTVNESLARHSECHILSKSSPDTCRTALLQSRELHLCLTSPRCDDMARYRYVPQRSASHVDVEERKLLQGRRKHWWDYPRPNPSDRHTQRFPRLDLSTRKERVAQDFRVVDVVTGNKRQLFSRPFLSMRMMIRWLGSSQNSYALDRGLHVCGYRRSRRSMRPKLSETAPILQAAARR